MKIMNHRFILSLLIYIACSINTAFATTKIETLEDAISVAGNQRTITQTLLKNYSLIGVDIRARKAKQDLKQAIDLFSQQLSALQTFKEASSIAPQLAVVEKLWQEVKNIYEAAPDRKQLENLVSNTELLLQACNQIVLTLEKQTTNEKAKLLDISSQQQMLSQRLVSLSALKAWKFEELYKADYQVSIALFEENLKTLTSYNSNTTEIVADLTEVKEQFERFLTTISVSKENYALAIALTSAEKVSLKMAEVTQKYLAI